MLQFQTAYGNWVFFCLNGKKRNTVPTHKNNQLKSYRPVSLLLMCGKIFEKLIYNEMFKSFIENELISPNQSDSSLNQLLCKHKIYQLSTKDLDISKTFGKVWNEGLNFRLKQNGISGNLLNLLCHILRIK